MAGILFTGLEGFLPLGGFFMLLLVYMFGTVIGNVIFKLARRKLGSKVAVAVALGLISGSFSASFAWQQFYGNAMEQMIARSHSARVAQARRSAAEKNYMSEKFTGNASSEDDTQIDEPSDERANISALARPGMAPSPISLALIVFTLGTLSPFLGWSAPMPSWFRR
jgi:hypothetical protein